MPEPPPIPGPSPAPPPFGPVPPFPPGPPVIRRPRDGETVIVESTGQTLVLSTTTCPLIIEAGPGAEEGKQAVHDTKHARCCRADFYTATFSDIVTCCQNPSGSGREIYPINGGPNALFTLQRNIALVSPNGSWPASPCMWVHKSPIDRLELLIYGVGMGCTGSPGIYRSPVYVYVRYYEDPPTHTALEVGLYGDFGIGRTWVFQYIVDLGISPVPIVSGSFNNQVPCSGMWQGATTIEAA